MFKQFLRDTVSLVKSNGQKYEDIKANVQSEVITIHDTIRN